ncbi:uncharacterized protein METZ01_LOCUS233388 [marine metagenome]|uniref:Uncharacterized protein n=1 Tax=marine metagenome TaxID=408172 RepID=A0A382H008_9ZZZZ
MISHLEIYLIMKISHMTLEENKCNEN